MKRLGWTIGFTPALLTGLLLAACQPSVGEVRSPAQIAETSRSADLPVDPDPALWVIKDADTTIYLFGTVHLLRAGTIWFDDEVKQAFDASQELVTEMIDPDPPIAAKIIAERAFDSAGTPLRSKLSPEDKAAFEKALTAMSLPLDRFDTLEPWFASVNLSLIPLVKAGFDPAQGAEKLLIAGAQARNLKHVGLESFDQQISFFDDLPLANQIAFLNSAVESQPDAVRGMDQMVGHWARAETDELARMMNEGLEDPLVYRALLADRNQRWAQWIAGRLQQPGTIFIAVGAGHLAGKESVQTHLTAMGITTSRVAD